MVFAHLDGPIAPIWPRYFAPRSTSVGLRPFRRTIAREDRCFFLRCYRKPTSDVSGNRTDRSSTQRKGISGPMPGMDESPRQRAGKLRRQGPADQWKTAVRGPHHVRARSLRHGCAEGSFQGAVECVDWLKSNGFPNLFLFWSRSTNGRGIHAYLG